LEKEFAVEVFQIVLIRIVDPGVQGLVRGSGKEFVMLPASWC
jgi:hypothetical protein